MESFAPPGEGGLDELGGPAKAALESSVVPGYAGMLKGILVVVLVVVVLECVLLLTGGLLL